MNTIPLAQAPAGLTLLSKLDDYELVYENQDVRGWEVRDQAGSVLGHVRDFLVDTHHDRVAALVLDNDTTCTVEHITIADHVVLLDGGVGRASRRLASPVQAAVSAPASASGALPLAATALGSTPVASASRAATGGVGAAGDARSLSGTSGDASAPLVIPVIEEEMRVSKRGVDRGHVRVNVQVVDRPVDQQVTLREEHVHVERHPVDLPVSPGETGLLQDRTVALVERVEEAVVAKQARVVEEVLVSKEVVQHTEQVHGTVRHTEVQVEHLDAFDPARYEEHYRQHLASGGLPFQEVAPAYGFGHMLRRDQRYAGQEWSRLEADARHVWESRHPGSWERVKSAVHHAWTEAGH